MKDINQYKKDWFIEPSLKKNGFSVYPVRKGLLAAVKELKSKISGRVLDLACGVMPYREFLKANGNITEYLGVDWQGSEYHNAIKPDAFWDGKNIPFEDESFDWVIATEFFEHYFDTPAILKEIFRVLKKDGTLFFTVPFVWDIHEAPHDMHRFTPYSLKQHFEKASYSGSEIRPLGGNHTSMAIMLGLWYEKSIGKIYKFLFWPFVWIFYKFLTRKNDSNFEFGNGMYPSGLYGFVKK